MSLKSLLISKIKYVRECFTELGYSQIEFELYFLIHILACSIDINQPITSILLHQVQAITTKEQIVKVLAVLDQEAEAIGILVQEKENADENSSKNGQAADKQLLKKRRTHKQPKKIKKPKMEENNKQKNNDLPPEFLSLMMSSQGHVGAAQGDCYQESKEKELVLQKLLEIQMLNRILCGADRRETRLQDLGFMMSC